MKIAHVGPEFYPAIGGVGQVMREIATRQIKAGHEVHVYVPDWDKKTRVKKKEEIIDGIKVHRCRYWFKAGNFSTFWPSLFPRLLKGNFNVIHSHLFAHPHFVLSSLASKIKKIPHFHTTHCPWSDAPRPISGKLGVIISYNFFSRLALKSTEKLIAITPWENSFIKKYGGREDQIVNLPNGMGEQFFSKIKNNKFRQKHKIKGHLVLFFGRLSFTKAPDKFVEIAKLILKNRNDVTFVIRGPDEGLKEKVKKLIGNEKRIVLLGETRDRKEIIEMYQSADVFVLPSYREGLPLTLFEAMASGLPIVATPVNGIPYEMKEPENGFLLKYGDNEGFAKKINELLDNKKLRDKISKNNVKKSEKYKWNTISSKTLNLYKNSLKK